MFMVNIENTNPLTQTNLPKAVMNLCSEFEKHLKRDSLYGIQYIWKNAFYSPIKAFINKKTLTDDETLLLNKFINLGIEQLKLILDNFPEIENQVVLYIGDLYRYAYFNCGLKDNDRILAEEYYSEVLNFDNANSLKAFNQIGLLYSKKDSWKSLKFYLRYLTLTSGIEKNIGFLKTSILKQHQRTIFELIKSNYANF